MHITTRKDSRGMLIYGKNVSHFVLRKFNYKCEYVLASKRVKMHVQGDDIDWATEENVIIAT